MNTLVKNCLNCNKTLQGRADKKFCDDYCRNAYNNKLKSAANNLIRKINYTLSKNRRILASLLPEDEKMVTVTEEKLNKSGFDFKYNTHHITNKNGQMYFFCYEYGYLPLENHRCLIVKQKEEG
jgi:hypothetical protein